MKYLKTVDVCGQAYRVYRCTLAEMPDSHGECVYEQHKIKLREGCDADTFQHELRHAYWHHSGLGVIFADITGLKGKKLEEAEELFLRVDTPACLATWRSAGLLKGRKPRETEP